MKWLARFWRVDTADESVVKLSMIDDLEIVSAPNSSDASAV